MGLFDKIMGTKETAKPKRKMGRKTKGPVAVKDCKHTNTFTKLKYKYCTRTYCKDCGKLVNTSRNFDKLLKGKK